MIKGSVKRKIERIDKLRSMRRVKKEKVSTFKQTKIAVERARQERQSFEGSSCVTAGGKKAPMAKRVGPKIRDRNRAEVLERLRESKKLNKHRHWDKQKLTRTDRQPKEEKDFVAFNSYRKQKESRKRLRKQSPDQNFDKLVAKYAKKLKSSNVDTQERPKWFS